MNNIILSLEGKNIFTQRIIFARTLLALNALLTLIFNDVSTLSDVKLLGMETFVSGDLLPFRLISIFELIGMKWGSVFSIIILLFVFTGYYPKISIILQAWVHVSLCNSLILVEGGDQVAANLSLLLIPICLFDCRKNQWQELTDDQVLKRKHINVFFNVYYFLIILQVSIIYLHSATGKLLKEDWLDGTCLYYWSTHNIFGAPLFLQKIFNLMTLSSFAPIFAWGIIMLELGLFACLLATNKYIKRFFLVCGLLFHLTILVTHGLVTFFFAMFGALVLYLDSENEICKKMVSVIKIIYSKLFSWR
jgi:antimicrobial peptide system SdpB family protein